MSIPYRVLQIANYMFPHRGGIEQVALNILQSLKGEDIEQKILCFNEDAEADGIVCYRHMDQVQIIQDVEVIRCGCQAKIASQSISGSYERQLKTILSSFCPDLVIFHYPNPFAAHFLLKYLSSKTKLILYWHLDITKQKFLRNFFNGQNKQLLERADRIVATSPNYVEGSPWLSIYKNKVSIIPNCINENRLVVTEEIRKKAELIRKEQSQKILCLGVGRMVPYKGFTYLIQAAKQLDSKYLIQIIGKGELERELKKQAADIPNVEFLGALPDKELIAHLLACDIFCFPSITKNEAFGISLAEGMYFKKPAVTFTIPGSGVNYVNLDQVTGLECPNRSVLDFANAIRKLGEDKALRCKYGEAAHQRVEGNFMFDAFSKKIKSLVKETGELNSIDMRIN